MKHKVIYTVGDKLSENWF